MFGHGYMKDKISNVNRSKHNDNLTFRMFQNVLSKIVQFTNDIMQAVNHVLFKQLIFISVEICCIICPFIPRRRKRRKKKKKRSIHYIYYKEEKRKSLIHAFLNQPEKQYKVQKLMENIESFFNQDQLLYCSLLSQFVFSLQYIHILLFLDQFNII